jgi:hippurate hydrolase
MEVTHPFGGTGVVGVFRNGKGKTLLLRSDLDALPITEKTPVSYASKTKVTTKKGSEVGVMHACGHDIHMTNLTGTVRSLIQNKSKWKGTLLAVGQPAEEIGAGAKNLLEAGLYKKFPKPDYALAFHVDSHIPTGSIGYVSGPVMAGADTVRVTIKGRGGHGALPQETIDPIVMASRFVLDLQTIISRERDPNTPSVISVGQFHCGTKANITPESCQLDLTVRSFTEEERQRLFEGIKRKAFATAQSSGAPKPEVEVTKEGTPPTVNDPALTAKAIALLETSLGKKALIASERATVSEDFSHFSEGGVPTLMLFLGSVNESRLRKLKKKNRLPSLHSAFYYPDAEETLETGITALSSVAEGLLQ